MDLRRLRAGEWIAGAGGVLLLVSLFLPWYEGTHAIDRSIEPLTEGDFNFTAWESLSGFDVVFALGALVAIALGVVAATQRTSAVPIALSALVTLASLLLGVLVLFRLASVPTLSITANGATVVEFTEGTRQIGLWLALAGVAMIFVGGLVSMRDERITGDTRSVGPADIDTLPAPPAGA